jgi:hypothetical protein
MNRFNLFVYAASMLAWLTPVWGAGGPARDYAMTTPIPTGIEMPDRVEKAPAGMENNWIQTIPGKGWNILLRLYGPLQPWFDKSWRPSEIEPLD